jgi:hypothetical protein
MAVLPLARIGSDPYLMVKQLQGISNALLQSNVAQGLRIVAAKSCALSKERRYARRFGPRGILANA